MSNDLRVAVLGGRGMLGTDVVPELQRRGLAAAAFDLPEWDLSSEAARAQALAAADLIVNCAAYTNVDGAEKAPEVARRVNATAVGELARATAAAGKYLLHVSTDFVFDGTKHGAYTEDDVPRPLGVYGQTKLEGEELVRATGGAWCILRVQWTYGVGGNNFVRKILTRACEQGKLSVVNDQYGAPTATTDVARAIADLLARRATGLYHFAARGCATRYDVAAFICQRRRLDVPARPCGSADFPTPARRPANSCFSCAKIEPLLSFIRPTWPDALAHYLDTTHD